MCHSSVNDGEKKIENSGLGDGSVHEVLAEQM